MYERLKTEQSRRSATLGDYELVITNCKRLEGILEKRFGASGRGLHEKVTSVQARLPEPLIKKLRYIATIRNQLVHEEDKHKIDDKAGFQRASKEAEKQLTALLKPTSTGLFGWKAVLIALGVAALAAAFLYRIFAS